VLGYRIAAGQSANFALPPLAGALVYLGWEFPFLLFALSIPVSIFAYFVLEAGGGAPGLSVGAYIRGVARALANKRVAGLLTCAPTLMIVGQGAVATYLPIYMASALGAPPVIIGVILSSRVAAGIMVSLKMGWLAERFGGDRLTIASVFLLAFGTLLVPFTDSVWQLLVPGALIGVATGVGFPAFQTLLVNEAPDTMRAAVTAANGMTNRFGQTVGPLLGGAVYALGGLDVVFFGASVFLLAMAAVYIVLFGRRGATTPS
jgi:ACDE family multidrug resistance protein